MIPLGMFGAARTRGGTGTPLTGTFLQAAVSTADASSYTFAAQNVGPAEGTRRVVVTIVSRKAAPSATLTAVTIGGVSATIAAQVSIIGNTTAIAYAHVPAGSTADVVVTWSTTVLRCGIGMWSITGGAVSVTTGTGTGTGATATVTGLAGGFTVAGVCITGGVRVGWTGADERYEGPIESFTHSGADSIATGSITISPVVDTSPDSVAVVAAVFAPA